MTAPGFPSAAVLHLSPSPAGREPTRDRVRDQIGPLWLPPQISPSRRLPPPGLSFHSAGGQGLTRSPGGSQVRAGLSFRRLGRGLGVCSLLSSDAVFPIRAPALWVSRCLSPWTRLPDFLSADPPASLLPSRGTWEAIGPTWKILDAPSLPRSADQQPSPSRCQAGPSQVWHWDVGISGQPSFWPPQRATGQPIPLCLTPPGPPQRRTAVGGV